MRNKRFEVLWRDHLEPALTALEIERRKATLKLLGIILLFFSPYLLFVLGGSVATPLKYYIFISCLFLIATGLFLIIKNKNSFHQSYKQKIYSLLRHETRSGWQLHSPRKSTINDLFRKSALEYPTLRMFSRTRAYEEFKQSGLYTRYSRLSVDDVLQGRLNGRKIKAVEYRAQEVRSNGRTTYTVTIFAGFLVTIQLDQSYRGETFIRTENDRNNPFARSKTKRDSTKLEWNEFEDFLHMESTDPIEAREIFAPDFMQVIYDWWVEHKRKIRMSFKEDKIYIAIPTPHRFEASIFRQQKQEKESIKDHLELLWFIEDVTEILIHHQRNKFR